MDNKKEYYSYVEELYKEAAGRGEITVKIINNISEIKEEYKFNRIIGNSNLKYIFPPTPSVYEQTKKIGIRYSKKGYHLFPISE